MNLSDFEVRASVAVSDMGPAREFYEKVLGLSGEPYQEDGSYVYRSGPSRLHVYPSEGSAGKAPGTVATWIVDDVDTAVDALVAAGVVFEQYDEPKTNERGVYTDGTFKVAWFKDPDGNTFALES